MFTPGKSGNPKGKIKGTLNKSTLEVKETIEAVYAGIGGTEAFITWAKEHSDAFYTAIYSKLIPRGLEVGGKDGRPIQIDVIKKYLNIGAEPSEIDTRKPNG